ncbi:hypothetical protein E2C01_035134 [Portunus trituberculatus]|uniref:Uncharacterized protein n=1 Tax=Portunus trituberculatus TaxID=210409 RepID=A0A5B7F7I0_PORTR|nr:hypothetical protein [Portunus trituberculatus]
MVTTSPLQPARPASASCRSPRPSVTRRPAQAAAEESWKRSELVVTDTHVAPPPSFPTPFVKLDGTTGLKEQSVAAHPHTHTRTRTRTNQCSLHHFLLL